MNHDTQARWAPIPNAPGYEASDLGEIRRNGKVLKQGRCFGYRYIGIAYASGRRCRRAHRVILEAFRGPDERPVRHLNGVRDDNRLSNLRYGTQAENEADKATHGTQAIGERNGFSKFTEDQVRAIRRRLAEGEMIKTLAAEYGAHRESIYLIKIRRIWKHV